MKPPIILPAILDNYSNRKDKTVAVKFVTQELTPEKVMEIHSRIDQFGVLYFRGGEKLSKAELDEIDAIDVDVYDSPRTQSQRLRGVLYVLWEKRGGVGEFKDFYKTETEKIINHYKQKLD